MRRFTLLSLVLGMIGLIVGSLSGCATDAPPQATGALEANALLAEPQITASAVAANATVQAVAQQRTIDAARAALTQGAPTATGPAQTTPDPEDLLLTAQARSREATMMAAIANATAQAAALQGTIDAARAALTEQAMDATDQAQATQDALALRLTVRALDQETTATAQALAAQATATQRARESAATAQALTQEAIRTAEAAADQATATEQAYVRTATAEISSRDATATAEAALIQATATERAHERTATANALYVAQTATAGAAARQQETLRYGTGVLILVLVIGLVVALVFGLRSRWPVVVLWDFLRGSEEADEEPCPPITVQPDGSVQIPMLRSPQDQECHIPQKYLGDVLSWMRLQAGGEGDTPPAGLIGAPVVPGLRSVHTLRRLDQAEKSGVIPPSLVAALEADWRRYSNEG